MAQTISIGSNNSINDVLANDVAGVQDDFTIELDGTFTQSIDLSQAGNSFDSLTITSVATTGNATTGNATIAPPAGALLSASSLGGSPIATAVRVDGGQNVTIENITIDGGDHNPGADIYSAVAVTGGTNQSVVNVTTEGMSGHPDGRGIYAGGSGLNGVVEVSGNTVTEFSNAGIVVDSVVADINGNTVTGTTSASQQRKGIEAFELRDGSQIYNNTITGLGLTADVQAAAAGIAVFGGSGISIGRSGLGNTVSGSDNFVGILATGGSNFGGPLEDVSILDNTVSGSGSEVSIGVDTGFLKGGKIFGNMVSDVNTGYTILANDNILGTIFFGGSRGDDNIANNVQRGVLVDGGVIPGERPAVSGAFDITGTTPGPDLMIGGRGDDTLIGEGGQDTLESFKGNDLLRGGNAADLLDGGPGADTMEGGGGNDVYRVDNTGDVVTELANEGIDTVFFEKIASYALPDNVENAELTEARVILNLQGNELDNVLNVELAQRVGGGSETPPRQVVIVEGNDGDDEIIGSNAEASLQFDDLLRGGAGNDEIFGNAGRDRLQGNEGADTLRGGAGDDSLTAGLGVDGQDRNELFGGTGDDLLIASHGQFAADDLLDGGAGNDTLEARGGANILTGGTGDDTFLFETVNTSTPGATDQITDFTSGEDVVDVSQAVEGGRTLEFIGSANFDGTVPRQIRPRSAKSRRWASQVSRLWLTLTVTAAPTWRSALPISRACRQAISASECRCRRIQAIGSVQPDRLDDAADKHVFSARAMAPERIVPQASKAF